MRFIIMHKTNAHWESGAVPSPELVARVGRLIGDLVAAKVLRGAEGLRPSSQGARLRRSGGELSVLKGPFKGGHELPAGFSIIEAASLDEAINGAARLAESLGDVEIDVRPFTEPWDIGMAPKPAGVSTRRYMALIKATAETEAGRPLFKTVPPPATETLRPSRRGRRYKNTGKGITWTDGPFSESKELVGGYVIVSAESLEDAARWVPRYIEAAEAGEVDLLELEEER